jgi:FkbM family methyltransferase
MLTTTVVYNHSFAPELIGGDWVIDCGANRGDFSAWVVEHTRAKVIAYEPDPRLFAKLPQHERVTYYNLALSAVEGQVRLFLGDKLCSSLVHAERAEVDTVRVNAVELGRHLQSCEVGTIGLLKLDIEGAELDVLRQLAPAFFARVKQITCEFHEFLDPATLPAVEEVIRHVEEQGFYALNFSRHNYGDVLFLNRRHVAVGWLLKANLYATKYLRGAARLLRRKALRVQSDR